MGTILIIILAVWCGLCEFSKKKIEKLNGIKTLHSFYIYK